MNGWRQRILNDLIQCAKRIAVAVDPDGLLREEKTANEIRKIGFDITVFEDSIEFRYLYESRYRDVFEQAHRHASPFADRRLLVIVLDPDDLDRVPFDVLRKAEKFHYGLADIFPQLSYNIVSQLKLDQLDLLWDGVIREKPDRLGENQTIKFVLEHVFRVELPESMTSDEDLLLTLMNRHYKNLDIPKILDEWYVDTLRKEGRFSEWPLEIIISDKRAFLNFLQERWALFLQENKGIQVAEGYRVETDKTPLKIPGPIDIPFDHEDIRVRLDNFFLEGLLEPVPLDPSYYSEVEKIIEPWIKLGIRLDTEEMAIYEIERLLDTCQEMLPEVDAPYDTWRAFSFTWAHLKVSIFNYPSRRKICGGTEMQPRVSVDCDTQGYGDYGGRFMTARSRFDDLQTEIDSRFERWMCNSFSALHNLPSLQPVMVHHVPRYLSKVLGESDGKIALLVLDGMAMDQWLVIKDELLNQKPGITFRESGVFAWVPTLTPVSRQTIFAGKLPMFLGDRLKDTKREAHLWTQFWADEGIDEELVGYIFLAADRWTGDDLNQVDPIVGTEVNKPRDLDESTAQALGDKELLDRFLSTNVLGIVVGKVDRIGHGIQLGTKGFYNQVQQWASEGYLLNLMKYLSDNGYRVFVTSDHGNIEAQGVGHPKQGVIPERKGERAIVYSSKVQLEAGLKEFPNAIIWEPIGLPDDFLPLIASGRTAFINAGETSVCHGGICIEEVIVPFVEVEFA